MRSRYRAAAVFAATCAALVLTLVPSARGQEKPDLPTCRATCALAVRDADHPARHAFQHEFRFTTPDGFSEFTSEFLVPAGKRLVIEHVSGNATPPAGQIVRKFSLRTTTGGVFAFHSVPVTFNGFADFVASASVRLYADGGTLVKLSAPRNVHAGQFLTVATVSGYLVDLP